MQHSLLCIWHSFVKESANSLIFLRISSKHPRRTTNNITEHGISVVHHLPRIAASVFANPSFSSHAEREVQVTQKGQKKARKTDQKSVVNIPETGYNERQEESVTEKPIKDFKELDLTDNFMFSAVMKDPELCRPLLEMILDVKIEHIEYTEKEKTIATKSETKSVRLDVYVQDGKGTVYDIEMQTTNPGNLPLRSRYYQAEIDTCLLDKGEEYDILNESFVIFICMKDVFGQGRPIYTFENRCVQDTDIALGDKTTKIFLNPNYKVECANPELANFLKFLKDGKPLDEYTERLVEAVEAARNNEYLNVEYMSMWAMKTDAHREGHAEGRAEGLAEGIVQTVKRMKGSIEMAADQLAEQCGMDMEKALETAKLYW